MIPTGGALGAEQNIELEQQPSRTYKLDLKRNRIVGMTDNKDAIEQAIFKILQTERFEHLIYTANYGSELKGLIGTNKLFIQSELKRRIAEALLNDDRISDVVDFKFTFGEGDVLVEFIAVTQYGQIRTSHEVKRNV